MAEWLERIDDAREGIRAESYRLEDLADAFARTGNAQMAETLSLTASALRAYEDQIGKAVGRHIGELLHEAEQATTDLFTAVIGGAFAAPKRAGKEGS